MECRSFGGMRNPAPALLALFAPVAAAQMEVVGQALDGTVLILQRDGRLARVEPGSGELLGFADDGVRTWVEVELDPTGTRVAGIDASRNLVIWSLFGGEVQQGGVVPGERWDRIRWTADGCHLVTWSEGLVASDNAVARQDATRARVWSAAGALVWEGPPASDVDVHPVRNELCISAVDAENVQIHLGWPEAAGGLGVAVVPLDGYVHSAAYSPDGSRVAATGTRPGPGGSSQSRHTSHLWILDATDYTLEVDRTITDVDPGEIMSRGECIRWSPDGRWLGVALGKGHAPGILDATDGRLRRSGGFRGGRFHESFPVAWLANGKLLSTWPSALFLDPDPKVPNWELPWMTRTDSLVLAGTNDIVCVALRLGHPEAVVRVDGATGAVRWSVPKGVVPMAAR